MRHVFRAERPLRHELYPVVLLTCPLRHRSVPLYSSVVEPKILCFQRVTFVGSVAIPHALLFPPQCLHDGDVATMNRPVRGNPDFVDNCFSQKCEAHVLPFAVQCLSSPYLVVHPTFVRGDAGSKGKT